MPLKLKEIFKASLFHMTLYFILKTPVYVFGTNVTTTIQVTTPSVLTKSIPTYRFIERTKDNFIKIELYTGANYVMNCELTISDPTPNITWTKSGKPLASVSYRFYYLEDLSKTFKLELSDIMITDAGEYKCVVGNDGDKKISKVFRVAVHETAENQKLVEQTLTPKEALIKSGENIKFVCKSKGGNDIPKFFRWDRLSKIGKNMKNMKNTWSSSNGDVFNVETIKVDQCSGESILEINGATTADSAIYSCVILNQREFIKLDAKLIVKSIPQAKESSGNHLIIIIPIVTLCIIIIAAIVFMFGRRIYKRHNIRSRTHSYHYTASTSEG